MAISKTFARGEILTAQDVNDYLNPSTAEHLAAAVAAGTAEGPFKGGIAANDIKVTFPPGRFTKTPVITITVVGMSSQLVHVEAHIYSASATEFVIRLNGLNVATSVTFDRLFVNWIAVEI